MIWNEETTSRLRQLIETKVPASIIGAVLGITRNAVLGKAFRMGLHLLGQKRPPSAPRVRKKYPQRLTAILQSARPIIEEPEPTTGLSLLELKSWHCRYAVSTEPAVFCGKRKHYNMRRDYPFCLAHCQKCYREFVA